ncbi:hypothetical protein WBP07_06895 [Novosphingobium sp. BL-8A]|uniref:hypothetical protein n=1 Tax=Novosphingobium sp. BL-8A TaxID=3127639 RepID=UPI0037569168
MATSPHYKLQTRIPPEITTPERVEVSIGALEFADGVPTAATAAKVFDNLDFLRGMEAFLKGVAGASLVAIRRALREVGATGSCMGIFAAIALRKGHAFASGAVDAWSRRSVPTGLPTGCNRCRPRAVSRSSASTAYWSRGPTGAGNCPTSKRSAEGASRHARYPVRCRCGHA